MVSLISRVFSVKPAGPACHDGVVIAFEGKAGLFVANLGLHREMNPVAAILKKLNYLDSAGIKSHW